MTKFKDAYIDDAELTKYMEELFHDVHMHPELGMEEHRTTEVIKGRLAEMGFAPHDDGSPLYLQEMPGLDVGALAVMRGAEPGPCLLIRADIDALPLIEDNDLPYKSTVPGKMHACGHDTHLTVVMGTIRRLVKTEFFKHMRGTLKFAFQPSEERRGPDGKSGAQRMIEAGALEDPKVDMALMLHSDTTYGPGEVALFHGGSFSHSNSDSFTIKINGKGGHSSRPDRTEDLILAGAYLVNIFQSIVARGIDPREAGVVSVCMFHAGDATNVFPAQLDIAGSVRTFKDDVRQFVIRRINECTESMAKLFGVKAEVNYRMGADAVPISAEPADLLRAASLDVLPDANVHMEGPGMGGEDFCFFAKKVPGAVLRLGGGHPGEGADWGGAHSPKHRLDAAMLPVGVSIFVRAVERYLGR